MRRLGVALVCLLVLALQATAASASSFPTTIPLPNGFAPEGIAIGGGTTFYAGSLGGNGIFRGDLRTGEGELLVAGDGRPFTGMKVDAFGRLWVSGATDGTGHVVDATRGDELATFTFASPPNTFVNDVVITSTAAYFTDSFQQVIYRVPIAGDGTIGAPQTIDLTGQFAFVPGQFNLNGIDATADGGTLIAVNSTTGDLVGIDPASETAWTLDLGGQTLTAGDGILLLGRTLYVVRNQLNLVAVVQLSPDLRSGALVRTIGSDSFDVPTTAGRLRASLYIVNARFGTPVTPDAPYWVTRIDAH